MVLTFNLPGINQLNLSVSDLPDMYEGRIVYWNDPRIQSVNPQITLPEERILQVARMDDAEDTMTFTAAMKNFDEDNSSQWSQVFYTANFTDGICCKSQAWPDDVDYYGKDFVGTAGIVMSIPYTLAYMATVIAESYDIPYATLINRQQQSVRPTAKNIFAALRNAYDTQKGLDLDLFSINDPNAYPITYLVYVVINTNFPADFDCCKIQETLGLIDYLFNESRGTFDENFVVPILLDMKTKIRNEVLSGVQCSGSAPYDDYIFSIFMSENSVDPGWSVWKIILTTVGVAGAVCVLFTTCWLWNRWKHNALEEAKWLIPFDEIHQLNRTDSQANFDARNKPWDQKFQFLHPVVEYGGTQVCLELLPSTFPLPTRWKEETKATVRYLRRKFNHPNLAVLHGITAEGPGKV